MTITVSGVHLREGVDVSNWQGSNNWAGAKAAVPGLEFAWCKRTEGAGAYTDPFYNANVGGAQENGIIAGGYHFMRPGRDDPRAELAHFLERRRGDELLVDALDVEAYPHPDPKVNTRNVLIFLEGLAEAIGRLPWLYSYMPFLRAHLDLSETALGRFPLWAAAYGQNTGAPSTSPDVPRPWDGWEAWQYTSNRPVAGLGSRIDANLADPAAWDSFLQHPGEIPSSLSPVGWVDRAYATDSGIHVAGWAADPDNPFEHVKVHIYSGNEYLISDVANESRPDVEDVYPEYGPRRGFGTDVELGPGRYEIKVYALDTTGDPNVQIGETRRLEVKEAAPAIPAMPGTTAADGKAQIAWLKRYATG